MSPGWWKVQVKILVLMTGCLLLSVFEVERPLGAHSRTKVTADLGDGARFPLLAGRDENGPIRFQVPSQGELSLVFVISPFCDVCEDEAPNLRRIMLEVFPREGRPLPIDVFLVSLSPPDLARGFIETHGLMGQLVAADSNNPSGEEELQTAMRFSSAPEGYMVGKDGRVLLQAGSISAEIAEEWVATLWKSLDSQ